MNQTIVGEFFTIHTEDLQDTTEYLSRLGMTFSGGIEKCLFYIELKEMPEILFKLERSRYFDCHRGRKKWDILKISGDGVVLYISSPYGDGYVFLPKENIISIHTINEEFLDAIALRKS